MAQDTLAAQFKIARSRSTPIIAVNTPDPAATIKTIVAVVQEMSPKAQIPCVEWDILRGYSALNKMGEVAVKAVQEEGQPLKNPDEALGVAENFAAKTVVFIHNAARFLSNSAGNEMTVTLVGQGIWNLRDAFKSNQRTLVLLGTQFILPDFLETDTLVLNEPLPTQEEIVEIVDRQIKEVRASIPEYPEVEGETLTRAVDALRGLAAFPAEQVIAMSLTKQGLDINALWERKREKIRQTRGLSVWAGSETYASIGGCENVKGFLKNLVTGPAKPRVVIFIDEIEKALAGVAGDTSGVSQEMLGRVLSWMQDTKNSDALSDGVMGTMFIGPPGAAKSAIAKAVGNEVGIPTICFDLSAMKGSLVGESTMMLNNALRVIDAVSDNAPYVIATCNSIGVLPPELRRRFTCGTFFFDLPTPEECSQIWGIYVKKYGLSGQEIPESIGWTGAEIKQCCEFAWRLRVSLSEAARYIVPVSVVAREQIEKLREQAHERFLSASYPGVYVHKKNPVSLPKARKEYDEGEVKRAYSLE